MPWFRCDLLLCAELLQWSSPPLLPETPDVPIPRSDRATFSCVKLLAHACYPLSAFHTICLDAQGSLPNQDAACSAGALMPLLELAAAGPDQVAVKSAALAISALVCNHTANQDAVRYNYEPPLQADGSILTCNSFSTAA